MGQSGAAGEPASGATGLVEALRTGVWSPGSGLRLGAAWLVTWGARLTFVHFRLQSSEPGGSGLVAWTPYWPFHLADLVPLSAWG